MADRRIRIPKQHDELISRLVYSKDNDYNGPFKFIADAFAFAAAYGSSLGKREPFSEALKDPIRQSVFDSSGYGTLINLLAVSNTKDPNILSDTDEKEDERITIFEEFANSGLSRIDDLFKNESDFSQSICLILKNEHSQSNTGEINISGLI